MVPEPRVAATREKIDPDVPPALNLRYVNLTGDMIMSAYLVLRVPPSESINDVVSSLSTLLLLLRSPSSFE